MQSDNIEYSTRQDCPGAFFRCSAMSATISVASCSRMWKEANARKKDPCDRLHHCQGCETGSIHSDVAVVRSNDLYGARLCSRCHKPSARLIGDELCPSCVNRQYEVLKGKNGKGTKPVKHPPLVQSRIKVACGGKVQEMVFEHTVDPTEAFVSVLRHMQGCIVFGFRSSIIAARPRPVQLELIL